MFSNLSKGLKITLITIISVILAFCCCSMVLYYFLPVVEKNITLGMTTDVNGDPYIDVEYWSNKENNGVELLDIRLHGYATVEDFKKDDSVTYYKGIQFVGDEYGSIQFNDNYIFLNSFWEGFGAMFGIGAKRYSVDYVPNSQAYFYDYQNDVAFKSIDNLDDDYRFKVSLGPTDNSKLYFMKLLGLSNRISNTTYDLWISQNYYMNYDLMYLSSSLLNAIRTNSKGNNATGSITLDVGTMFDYMEYSTNVSNQQWLSVKESSDEKIKTYIQEFAMVNFTVHSDGAKKASDSMFGIIADSNDFEYSNPDIKDTYLYGKQVLDLTEKHFVFKEGKFDFSDRTKKFIDNTDFNLSIVIDLDNLTSQDIEFNGFHDNVKTYKNRILKVDLKSTDINGIVTYSEVIL